jgi:hypothetical protein
MGELLVGGNGKRFEFNEDGEGVWASDALSELGEPEETETARDLRAEVLMAMGSEGLTGRARPESSLVLAGNDIVDKTECIACCEEMEGRKIAGRGDGGAL